MADARCGWIPRSFWCAGTATSISTSAASRQKTLLKYFPRLEEIAHKTLFGTDWPGPGVPEIEKNLVEFRALALSESAKEQILSKTALEIWPA